VTELSTANYKTWLNWLIKLTLIAVTGIFIIHRLHNKDLGDFLKIIKNLDSGNVVFTLSILTTLMLINWIAEAYKWRMLVADVAPISMWTSVQSVFCGLSIGVITPNRIGEYGSRVFFLRPKRRVYGLIALATGGLAHFILTNVLATIVVSFFLYQFKSVKANVAVALGIFFAVYTLLLLLLYFNMRLVQMLIGKIKFINRYKHFFNILSQYKRMFLLKVMVIDVFRIGILIVQYYFIVHLLVPLLGFWQITLMSSLIISAQSVLPTVEVLDVGVRGATSVYFFHFITAQDVSILAAAAVIWFVNLMIPAIIGLCFVYKLKLFHQN